MAMAKNWPLAPISTISPYAMNTLCAEALLNGQCCFQGRLSRIEIQGKADAAFISPEALAHPHLKSIRFSPPIAIQQGDALIKDISLLSRPEEIDALPWVPKEQDLGYRVSYHHAAPEPKLRIQLYLDAPVDTRGAMALAFSGPIPNRGECKSGDECRLIWPSTQEFGLELDHGSDGLGQLAEGFPKEGSGGVQRVKLEIQSGSLRCRDEAGRLLEQKAPQTLEWEAGAAPGQAKSLRVGAIYLDQGGLQGEVVATGLAPKDAKMSLVLPLAAGAMVLLAALGLGLWRYAKTKRQTQKVFISYAPEDKELLMELEKALRKSGRFETWHAGKLDKQGDEAQQIAGHMERADILLLLLSADYLASDALWDQTQAAIRLHQEKKKRLFQVHARPCNVDIEPYSEIESLPKDKQAISLLKPGAGRWRDIVEALPRKPDGE